MSRFTSSIVSTSKDGARQCTESPIDRGPFDGLAKNAIGAHGYPAEEIPRGPETDQMIAAVTGWPENDIRFTQQGKGILNGFHGDVRHIGPDHDNPMKAFPEQVLENPEHPLLEG